MFRIKRRTARGPRPATKPSSLLRFEPLEGREMPAGLFATISDPGTVILQDSTTWTTKFTVHPFTGFTGSLQVAIADVNGDGTDDAIVAAGNGHAPQLEMYSGTDGSLIRTLNVGDANSTFGISVCAAGKNASSEVLLCVGTVLNNVSTAAVIKATNGTVISSFKPFGSYTGPINVASADLNADGIADVVVGAGAGGAPRVAVFDGANGNTLFNRFVYETTFTGGVFVSTGDVNGDGKQDVVASAGFLGGPRVAVYSSTNWSAAIQDFFAFDQTLRAGVQASVFAASVGGSNAIIAIDGKTKTLAAFNGSTLSPLVRPNLPGLPGGPPMTMTAPTYLAPTTDPTVIPTDAQGMVSVLPNVNDPNWVAQGNGLKIWDVAVGSGTAVTASSHLNVYYTGWLLNGTTFDSNRTPKSPISFALTGLIQGWQQGLLGMQPGGIRRLYIPSALGYGTAGSGSSIPPNSDLVFEIKLVSVS